MTSPLRILALVAFMVLVVLVPEQWPWGLAIAAVVLAVAITASAASWRHLLPRMVVEVPFVVFALVLPFVAHGPRVEVLGMAVSEPGLVAAGTLLAKGTLGVLAALLLAATTPPADILDGLARLRMPAQIVSIMGFMVRYLEVVTDELRRMRQALASRGFRPRDPRHWPVLARSLGALFVRSYERGERVHLAMLSRGYAPTAPEPRP